MRRKTSLLLTFIFLCSGLAAQQDTTKPGWIVRREAREEAQWLKQQEKMYAQAVEAAQEVTARKMVNDLWGVNDPQVTRSEDSLVLVLIPLAEKDVLRWTGHPEKTAPASVDPQQMWWVSLDPQLSALLQNEPVMDSASLAVSLKQLLGLPPGADYSYVATFWVSPRHLFRPTPNPDPTIHYSTIRFPADVDPAHKTWMEQYEQQAYSSQPPHAWTRLGYAYDWGNPVHPVGVSQFVVKSNSPIRVASLSSFWYWYSQQVDAPVPIPIDLLE